MSTTSSLFNNNNPKYSSFNHRKAHLCRSPLRILRVSDAAWFTSLGNPAVCDYTSREQRSAFIPTLTFILQRHNNTTKVCPNSTNEMKDFAKKKRRKKALCQSSQWCDIRSSTVVREITAVFNCQGYEWDKNHPFDFASSVAWSTVEHDVNSVTLSML